MSLTIVFRQFKAMLRTVVDHVVDDPVVFGMQVSRRLPQQFSRVAAGMASALPSATAQAISAWLKGDTDTAREFVRARPSTLWEARILGELALNLGDRQTAERISRATHSAGSLRLAARIKWFDGDMTGAVRVAPQNAMRERLASELRVFQPGWAPASNVSSAASAPRSMTRADVLFGLTNSLPHTQSGYTLRSHAVLGAVSAQGVRVLAANRTGYPTTVGKLIARPSAQVDSVEYLFDVPPKLARTLEGRLEQQSTFLRNVGESSRAQALHTTTHFTNGLVTRSAAEALQVPWVYEVRGALEDTWASSRGDAQAVAAALKSERYRQFQAREVEVATTADAVVTLGHTMAAELVVRGVPSEKILVAPNSVGGDVLAADWRRKAADVRDGLGLDRAGIWVGTAASIVGYEGLDLLIDAVLAARSQGVELRVLIVGDGTELPSLRKRASPMGDAAVFTGRVPSTVAQEYIQALDIFAVPRKDVSVSRLITPLKPVEAGGLGRAVIVSDLPALTEALPQTAHRSVRAGSVEELAEALIELGGDVDERERLGTEARAYVEAHRTWSALGKSYASMYERLGVMMRQVSHGV